MSPQTTISYPGRKGKCPLFALPIGNFAKPFFYSWFTLHTLCAILIFLCWGTANGQPYVSDDDDPPFFEIQARVRNGNSGFEAALFTPSTPPPGQPGGGPWQMNPTGAPIWNTNGNTYGDIHSFELNYTKATGTTVWKIDFNRDGDFNDPQEFVSNVAPTLVGKGFKYVNVRLQGNISGLTSSVYNFTINGINFGDYSSSSELPFSTLYEEAAGLFEDITVSGDFSFSGDGGMERPRIWVRLGTANEAPAINVTSPSEGTIFNIHETINIDADATDNGIIMAVEYYANAVLIGVDSFSPYTFPWSGVSPGLYSLTAKVVDSYDAFAVSNPVMIEMNAPPSGSIINPTDGFVFFDPDSLVIDAIAADTDDSVSVVEFYIGAVKIGEDSISPYHFTLISPAQAIYPLTVKAKDWRGGMTVSAQVYGIIPAPPVCNLSDPAIDGFIYYDPDTIHITAFADDPTDSVAYVDFFFESTPIGRDSFPPYENHTLVNTPMGNYTLSARATDIYGVFTDADPVSIIVRCIREDIDLNGFVNTNDYLLLLSAYGTSCTGCNEDFNDDGIVNTTDFLRMLTVMGHTCN